MCTDPFKPSYTFKAKLSNTTECQTTTCSFIQFDSTTRKFTVNTNNASLSGNQYYIEADARLRNGQINKITFVLELVASAIAPSVVSVPTITTQ